MCFFPCEGELNDAENISDKSLYNMFVILSSILFRAFSSDKDGCRCSKTFKQPSLFLLVIKQHSSVTAFHMPKWPQQFFVFNK